MKKHLVAVACSAPLAFGLLLAGCGEGTPGLDLKAPPPSTADWRVPDKLAVPPGNEEELSAVTAAERARVNYRYRLTVLQDFYKLQGNMDKLRWAEREIRNLENAYTFTWEGVPQVQPPAGESLQNADEHLMAEYAVSARAEFLKAVDGLMKFYNTTAPGSYKAKRLANVKQRFDSIRTYMYFMDAEMPPKDLKPIEVIPAADKLYAEGVGLYQRGKGPLQFAATTNYRLERDALDKFLKLVRYYPRSTKVAVAAFHIGEIYKEYFNEDVRAVAWYERAWTWDPAIVKPARFQAATVHDYRLMNKAKAIECYRGAIMHEQFNSGNVEWAHRRIRELTGT
jgi:TolA-binding protein